MRTRGQATQCLRSTTAAVDGKWSLQSRQGGREAGARIIWAAFGEDREGNEVSGKRASPWVVQWEERRRRMYVVCKGIHVEGAKLGYRGFW